MIELSWYGTDEVTVPLGAAFHPRRLDDAGQPGRARSRRHAEPGVRTRIGCALALDLLRDDRFDALITVSSPFADLPETMRRIAAGDLPASVPRRRLLRRDGTCSPSRSATT